MYPTFRRLYGHLAWADGEILAALTPLDPPLAAADRLFAHVVAAEHIWISRVLGRELGDFTPWTPLSRAECATLAAENHRQYLAVVDGPSEDRLRDVIAYRTTKGQPLASPLGDILLHVALHGMHHRGQIATLLSRADLAVPATDFILFGLANPLDD